MQKTAWIIIIGLFVTFCARGVQAQAHFRIDDGQRLLDTLYRMDINAPQLRGTIEDLIDSSQAHDLPVLELEGLSYLSFWAFAQGKDSLMTQCIEAAMDLARTQFDTLHPALTPIHYIYQTYFLNQQPEAAIVYGELVIRQSRADFIALPYAWQFLIRHYTYSSRREQLPTVLQDLYRRIEEGALPDTYRTLYWLGQLRHAYFEQDYERAARYGERCLASNDTTSFFSVVEVGPLCVEVGKIHGKLRRLNEAKQWISRGIALQKDKNSPSIGSYYANMGVVYADNKRFEEAIQWYDRAIAAYAPYPERYRRTLGVIYSNIFVALLEGSQYERLPQYMAAANDFLPDDLAAQTTIALAQGLSVPDTGIAKLQTIAATLDTAYQPGSYLPTTPLQGESAFTMGVTLMHWARLLRQKGYQQSDTAALLRALPITRRSDAYFRAAYQDQRTTHNERVYTRWFANNAETRLDIFAFQYTQQPQATLLDSALAATEESRAQLLSKGMSNESFSPAPATNVRQLQAFLAPDESLILYTTALDRIFIMLINSDTALIAQSPIIRADFLALLRATKADIRRPDLQQRTQAQGFIQSAHQLHQLLLAPIATHLRPQDKLIIIPDHYLTHLPFEILLPSSRYQAWPQLDFLIKRHPVSYHFSAQTLLLAQERPAINDGSLLAFAPDFGGSSNAPTNFRSLYAFADSSYLALDGDRFTPLPYATREARYIADLFPDAAVTLLGPNATKTALLQRWSSPRHIVHIATHGLTHLERPEQSALACYATASQPTDGLLYLQELQDRSLQADLVVLSSCESGIGQNYEGEGSIAFNYALTQAGARNVICTTEKINDKYGYQLMTTFYKAYQQSADYARALQAAKIHLLRSPIASHPRFWAPVLLTGR